MSIATDEADSMADEQLMSHFYYSDSPLSFSEAKNFGEDMYVAGRTAEPTALEVEESAYALWKTDVNMASLNPTEAEYTDAWGKLSRQQRDMYRSKASAVLEAARKEVAE